jgi:hypothetical protein
VRTTLEGLGAALSVGAIVAWSKSVLDAAESLHNLSQETGSSVENLSRLANQAKISGTNFDTIRIAIERLAAGIGGTEDSTTKTAQALKFLGITARDPAQALNDIALKLDKFSDGAGKAAIARDLFGRGGVQMIATLHEIAAAQDQAATSNDKQIDGAVKLSEAYRALTVNSTALRDAFLNDVVPAISIMVEKFKDAKSVGGDFIGSLKVFANLNPFGSAEDDVSRLNKEIGDLQQSIAKIKAQGATKLFGFEIPSTADTSNLEANLATATKALAAARKSLISELNLADSGIDRGFDSGKKPDLLYTGNQKPTGPSEAERYLDSLQKQFEKLQGLTVAEQALRDIEEGRIKGANHGLIEQILNTAGLIDKTAAAKKLQEEFERAQENALQLTLGRQKLFLQEADNLQQGNDSLRDEISLIGKDASARDALEQQQISGLIARKEDQLAILQSIGITDIESEALQRQIDLLKERSGLMFDKSTAEQLAASAKSLKDYANQVGDAFGNAFEEAIVNGRKLSDVIRGLEQDLLRLLSRKLVTEPLSNLISSYLTGGASAGGPNALSSFFASFFGSGGFTPAASTGFTDEAFALFSGFAGANGGDPPVGKLSLVGERGPELFLPRTTGTILPNDVTKRVLNSKSNVINITNHINVPAGTSRATADQVATQVARRLQRAVARNA